jgi:hypothetical protein
MGRPLRQVLWFVGIWTISVAALGGVSMVIRYWLKQG